MAKITLPDGTVFEGTPAEIAEYRKSLAAPAPAAPEPAPAPAAAPTRAPAAGGDSDGKKYPNIFAKLGKDNAAADIEAIRHLAQEAGALPAAAENAVKALDKNMAHPDMTTANAVRNALDGWIKATGVLAGEGTRDAQSAVLQLTGGSDLPRNLNQFHDQLNENLGAQGKQGMLEGAKTHVAGLNIKGGEAVDAPSGNAIAGKSSPRQVG